MSFSTLLTLPPPGNGSVTVIGSMCRSRCGRRKTFSGCPSGRCSASVNTMGGVPRDTEGIVSLQPVQIGHINNRDVIK